MKLESEHQKVLAVFAHYGFRKASMEDLAQAAGVSRQTLYKRFRNKEAVLDWAVEGFTLNAHAQVSDELRNDQAALADCLFNAFSCWADDVVPLFHDSPHGAEIMDLGIASIERSEHDFHADFEDVITQFLLDRNASESRQEAAEISFLLHMASKGLLLKSNTSEEYQTGMSRVIRTATRGLNE